MLFSKKRGGSREDENGSGEKVPTEGDLFFFQGRGRDGLCLGNGEKMGLWFPKERGGGCQEEPKIQGEGAGCESGRGTGDRGSLPTAVGKKKIPKIPHLWCSWG